MANGRWCMTSDFQLNIMTMNSLPTINTFLKMDNIRVNVIKLQLVGIRIKKQKREGVIKHTNLIRTREKLKTLSKLKLCNPKNSFRKKLILKMKMNRNSNQTEKKSFNNKQNTKRCKIDMMNINKKINQKTLNRVKRKKKQKCLIHTKI